MGTESKVNRWQSLRENTERDLAMTMLERVLILQDQIEDLQETESGDLRRDNLNTHSYNLNKFCGELSEIIGHTVWCDLATERRSIRESDKTVVKH